MCPSEYIYSNKNAVAEYLGLGTERQASYYLSAMKFFKFLTNSYELTDLAKQLREDENGLISNMKTQLLDNDYFKYLIDNKLLAVDEIARYLQKQYKNISDVTAKRRASTIKSWIKWMQEQCPLNMNKRLVTETLQNISKIQPNKPYRTL